jgi:hypothetical protein
MNGWTVLALLSSGFTLLTWAVAEATESWWIWPLGFGIALLSAGIVLFLSLVSDARNRQEGTPHA